MSTRMPTPRIVAYTTKTGRALVDCGQHVVWMSADEADQVTAAWADLTNEIRDKNAAVESVQEPPPTVVFEPELMGGMRRRKRAKRGAT